MPTKTGEEWNYNNAMLRIAALDKKQGDSNGIPLRKDMEMSE